MRIPRDWVLSAANVQAPPLPQGAQFSREVVASRAAMTEAAHADPANAAGNVARWMAPFEERRNQALASTEGLEPVSGPMNRLGRMLWWSPEERTLLSVLYHIPDGRSEE